MNRKTIGLICALVLCLLGLGGLVYAHRRVIRALVSGAPTPQPPAWHFWCRKK